MQLRGRYDFEMIVDFHESWLRKVIHMGIYAYTKDMYNYYNYDINDIKRRGANQDSHSNNVIVNIAVKFTQIS